MPKPRIFRLVQVGDQLPNIFQLGKQGLDLNPAIFNIKVGDISSMMLFEIIKVRLGLRKWLLADKRAQLTDVALLTAYPRSEL